MRVNLMPSLPSFHSIQLVFLSGPLHRCAMTPKEIIVLAEYLYHQLHLRENGFYQAPVRR